ncbi:MAG: hypothetical protein K2N34_00125 [Lachnospiraceae bacterium]|nr:hypothetical protein [Lachnospiraceae bacterium]
MMKKNRGMAAILKSNFAGWIVNYKIYIITILLIIFSLNNYTNVFLFAEEVGYRVTPFLFPFLFTHPFMHLVIFTSVIFLFANAPFVNSLQLLMMSRSGKKMWYLSQMIYLLLCTVILSVFLFMVPLIKNLNLIVLKNAWGKVLSTLAVYHDIIHPSSYYVINRYSPLEAMTYTILVFILISLFIGMTLMFCNTVFRNKSIGIIIVSAFVILDWLAYLTDDTKILWISPVSWINISNMAYARETKVPTIMYGIIVLVVLNLSLMLGTYLISGKKDVAVIANED